MVIGTNCRLWRRVTSLSRSAQPSSLCGNRGLAISCLILVDHTFRGGLVQRARSNPGEFGCLGGVTSVRSLPEPANGGSQGGFRRLVSLTGLLVRLDALELGLDVCHVCKPSGWGSVATAVQTRPLRLPAANEAANSFGVRGVGLAWNDGLPNPSACLRKSS